MVNMLHNDIKCIPKLTFAGLDPIGPCVIELCVTDISAVLEPSTAVSATAEFAGLAGGALVTSSAVTRRRKALRLGCLCLGEIQSLT